MHIFKITYVENSFTEEERSKYEYNIIEYAEDFGTYEISSGNIKWLEDELMTAQTVSEDEHYECEYTPEDRNIIKERIGSDVYDMLLNEEIDFIILTLN